MARGRSSDSAPRRPDGEEAERLLCGLPDMKVLGIMNDASNYTFLSQLNPYPPSGLRAVYKPSRGESPLWDFEAGSLYQREVAAYELSKVLGWPRVPATVVRPNAPHGAGSVQLFIEADGRHFLTEQKGLRDTWVRVALFDVITNNADRKSGHCLFDSEDNVWVVDHGLTFHVDNKLRTVIWGFAGDALPEELCGDIERALVEVEKGALGKKLEELLRPDEVRMLKRRLRRVLDSRWRFPSPTSAWSVPWPLV
jgi:hypothetical protein